MVLVRWGLLLVLALLLLLGCRGCWWFRVWGVVLHTSRSVLWLSVSLLGLLHWCPFRQYCSGNSGVLWGLDGCLGGAGGLSLCACGVVGVPSLVRCLHLGCPAALGLV